MNEVQKVTQSIYYGVMQDDNTLIKDENIIKHKEKLRLLFKKVDKRFLDTYYPSHFMTACLRIVSDLTPEEYECFDENFLEFFGELDMHGLWFIEVLFRPKVFTFVDDIKYILNEYKHWDIEDMHIK